MLVITPAKRERSPHTKTVLRIIDRQVFYFPEDVDPNEYEIVKYVNGDKICTHKGLNYAHFDQISYIDNSQNDINKNPFLHAMGYRIKEKRYTVLILQKKVTKK